MVSGQPFWQWNAWATQANQVCSWSMAGTLPDWQGAPVAVVILLEENDLTSAEFFGQTMLQSATNP